LGTEELLSAYLTKTRATADRAERSAVTKRVHELFAELGLQATSENDVWAIASDVGTVYAGLDDDEEVLSFWQVINTLSSPPKKLGEVFYALLCANADSTGACFAIRRPDDGGEPYFFIVGRIAAQKLDKEEIALTLTSVFHLSSMFD
jgi:hypothetical protein